MKKIIRLWMLAAMMMLGAFICVQGVSAAPAATQSASAKFTGWKTVNGYRYYYKSGKLYLGWLNLNGKNYYLRRKAEGNAPVGSMVTGLFKPYTKTLYYSSSGVLQTGWQTVNGKTCYFRKTGGVGTIGVMYTGGLRKVGNYYYLFGEDGDVSTGWVKYNGKLYCFSPNKTPGVRGRAYTGWHTIGGYKYYFNSAGVRQVSCWINDKYYVDKLGRRLTSCVTPDGYIVNEKGEKVKKASGWVKLNGNYYYYTSGKAATGWKKISGKLYYFNSAGVRQSGWLKLNGAMYYLKSGVMQTGWVKINSKKYYFYANGKMAVNTTVDGITIGANGVAETQASVLIIAGHGMGDPGATATYGGTLFQESKFTRQLATLVYNKLKASGKKISVTMYDQNYDCYQVNRAYQANKSVKGPLPDWKDYDYVLEIHFNATVASSKDPKGDGKYKGVSMYVYPSKKDTSAEKTIVASVSKATGFPIFGRGTGVFTSNLLNARTCYNAGVSYGLLETAFIDDKDDMAFYCTNRVKIAAAVADGILDALGF